MPARGPRSSPQNYERVKAAHNFSYTATRYGLLLPESSRLMGDMLRKSQDTITLPLDTPTPSVIPAQAGIQRLNTKE